MDAYLQSLLRRYAGGELDLSHQIARTVLRTVHVEPVSNTRGYPAPPKTIDDLIDILTGNITPLGILSEWRDRTLCGKAEFLANDKHMWFDLLYWETALATFTYSDSMKANTEAVKGLRSEVYYLFEETYHYPEISAPNYIDFPLLVPDFDSDSGKTLVNKLRYNFDQGRFPDLGFTLLSGLSRAALNNYFRSMGQSQFENVFGPLQPSSLSGQAEQRWVSASRISITPEGSFWIYGQSLHPEGINRLPLDSDSLYQVSADPTNVIF